MPNTLLMAQACKFLPDWLHTLGPVPTMGSPPLACKQSVHTEKRSLSSPIIASTISRSSSTSCPTMQAVAYVRAAC